MPAPRSSTGRRSPWPPNSACAPWSPTATSASAGSTAHGRQRERAKEHLTTATTMYREMDMRFWLEQAEAELAMTLSEAAISTS